MIRKSTYILTCLFILVACQTTQVTTGYYTISGSTEKELDQSIREFGPMNGHAFASAEISFKPTTMKIAEFPNRCDIDKARLQVIAKITLPRWKNSAGSSAALKQGFKNMQTYAKWHEKQHVKIAEAAAKAMERGIENLPPQKTCESFKKKMDAFIKRALSIHEKAQKKFDADEQKRLAALFKENS